MATRIEELVIELSANTKELQTDLKEATAVLKKSTGQMTKDIDKLSKEGSKGISALGASFAVATGQIIASGLLKGLRVLANAAENAAKNYLQFNQAVAEVNTILPKNKKLTDETKETFIKFAAEFGSNAQEQAKAFYQIVSAGVNDTAAATNLLNTANKAAIAGITDVETAVDGLTTVLNVYGDTGIDATRAADILFKTVQQGKTTFPELANTLGTVASTAKTAGLSFAELSGTIGFITTKGIDTTKAVTGLRGALVQLAAPTEGAIKAAKEFGIEIGEAALKEKGFEQVLRDVATATGGSLEKIKKLIPDIQAANIVATIAAGNFDDFSGALEGARDSADALAAANREVQKSANFQFQKLTASLENLPLLFFQLNDVAIADFLKTLNDRLPDALANAVEGFQVILRTLDFVGRGFSVLGAVISGLINQLATNLTALTQLISGDLSGALQTFRSGTIVVLEDIAKASEKTLLGDFADSLDGLSGKIRTLKEPFEKLAETQSGKLTPALDEGNKKLADTGKEADKASKELSKAQKAAEAFAESLIKASTTGGDGAGRLEVLKAELAAERITREEFFSESLALQRRQFQAEVDLLSSARKDGLVTEKEFQVARTQLQVQQLQESQELEFRRIEGLKEALDQELQAIEENNSKKFEISQERQEEGLIGLEEANIARLEIINAQFEAEQEALREALEEKVLTEGEFAERSKKIAMERDEAIIKSEKAKNDQIKKDRQDTESFIIANARSGGKILAAIGKALAIKNATISTFEAANKALAAFPPPLNFAAAATVTAAGIANVAKIAGLQDGIDSVPGLGNKDQFPALLAPGERVVPRETNQDLSKFLQQKADQPTQVNASFTINVEGNGLDDPQTAERLQEIIREGITQTGVQFG